MEHSIQNRTSEIFFHLNFVIFIVSMISSNRFINNKIENYLHHIFSEKVSVAKLSSLKPGADVAFKALLSARFCAAIWSHISDCDETFNYWDPLHYLVYGHGLQTWEYDPKFALRSYTYLLFHGVPAWFYNILFHPNPMLIFYFVRCLLGLFCAVMEAYFYKYERKHPIA